MGFLGLCASWYFASVWLGHRFLGLCGFGGFGWCFWFLVGDVWIVRFAVVLVVGFGFRRWLMVLLVLSVRFVAWVGGCVMLDFDGVV